MFNSGKVISNGILLMTVLPPPEGGIATWTKQYLKYCNDNNIKVRIVNMALIGKRKDNISNMKRSFRDEYIRTRNIFTDLDSALKEQKYDIVHYNSSCSKYGIIRDFLTIRKIAKYKIPIIFECHCNVDYELHTAIKKILFAKIAKKVNSIFVLNSKSEAVARKLTSKSIIATPNFIDEQLIVSKKTINPELKEIVYVGHIRREKGSFELIEAARNYCDIKFTLVGPVGSEIDVEKCPNNIIFEGKKKPEEVSSYLKKADAFVFPSYTEGFSLSLLEAMAFGLPIIATDVGANFDMLENLGGIIIEPQNAKELVEAIGAIKDSCVREKMSYWNINKVSNKYTVDKVMDMMLCEYKRVINVITCWSTVRGNTNEI